jgi:methylated-DNA-[protein]-cysteine S-methyltransferase
MHPARTPLYRGQYDSQLGRIDLLLDSNGALLRLDFALPGALYTRVEYASAIFQQDAVSHISQQLNEYFSGSRTDFDIELAPTGSSFLHEAWALLRTLPYGTTTTYGALAKTMGKPGFARAIGMANAVNPISIIVPCHRVIAANGALTGYSGGLDKKRGLLVLEAEYSRNELACAPDRHT